MKVCFRVDASEKIGSGHVMRCLTLAKEMKKKRASVYFITKKYSGSLNSIISREGYKVFSLENNTDNYEKDCKRDDYFNFELERDVLDSSAILKELDIDILVVDHYELDVKWEAKIKKYVKKIVVIDDMANRFHDCDVLLDQNYGRKEAHYISIVPESCRLLCGVEYSLIRDEFLKLKKKSIERRKNNSIKKVFISMGGADVLNISSQVLIELEKHKVLPNAEYILILGNASPHVEYVKKLISKLSIDVKLYINVNNMAELMMACDIAIGASGSTTWERCCLGLPTITLILAKNQKFIANSLNEIGAVKLIGCPDDISWKKKLIKAFENFKNNPESLYEMSKISESINDGLGVKRVVEVIL